MYQKILDKLLNKNIAILGFGKEGMSTYKFIRKYSDMPITIIDKKDVSEQVKDDDNVTVIYGDDYLDHIRGYDYVIKSPGVITKDIDTTGIPFTSELELLLEFHRSHTVGITATKGKSTTTTLCYQIFKDQGLDAYLLGNIGTPIFDDIEKFNEDTWAIVEMSALQLEFATHSPRIAAILNLYQDHLDHAGTVEHYHANKLNIFKYQYDTDDMIYCSDIEPLNSYINDNYKAKHHTVSLSDKADVYLDNGLVYMDQDMVFDTSKPYHLLGEHNVRNIMVCLMIAKIMNFDMTKVEETIRNFKPLEHRIELVGTVDDITFYNDSISTTPESTIMAIRALKNIDTLIFGGMDRGIDYNNLIGLLDSGIIRNLIGMPTTGYKIIDSLTNENINTYKIERLEDAVKCAKEVTNKGSICILSPAASSYEYFKNFEEKGRAFKKLVKED